MMQDAIVRYKIKLLTGPNKGKKIELTTTLNDLEEQDISDLLIEEEHLESCGWPTDSYEVLERHVHVLEEGASF